MDGSRRDRHGLAAPGTVLDGEAVIYNENRAGLQRWQSRAHSGPARARELAAFLPASYAVFDVLARDGQDVRGHPYTERPGPAS
ncbi:hypothetical protein [Streptomyces sp. NPDC058695]|uniref:ATP-dependent DNA ligase n=1 Tax=Streptomyces sp. NPDC058695 TaxID=3346604 RepID=UPI003658E5FF